jgi:hypothetical protein
MKNVPQRKAHLALDAKQTDGQLRENFPFEMSLYYMPLSRIGSARLEALIWRPGCSLCHYVHTCMDAHIMITYTTN